MGTNENIFITQTDYEKISALVSHTDTPVGELLEEELGRAEVVSQEDMPKDAVSMNSQVIFEDLELGKETKVTLVYPHEANIEENKISILTPIGSALIGLRVGQKIEWPLPSGKTKEIKVKSVENGKF